MEKSRKPFFYFNFHKRNEKKKSVDNLKANYSSKILGTLKNVEGEQFDQFRCHRLPKVDEELHVRTIFEPVSVVARPAKTKPKIRSKLRWKEDVDSKEKTEESKCSTANSDKAISLNIKNKKESGQAATVEWYLKMSGNILRPVGMRPRKLFTEWEISADGKETLLL
uniref:Origin recognition complex subunit 1 n=1 Tax=Loa loa TaxID=7209 RepID=A0A1I7VFJ5_LOALO